MKAPTVIINFPPYYSGIVACEFSRYQTTGHLSLQLWAPDKDCGGAYTPLCRATVNPDHPHKTLLDTHLPIKDYRENMGILGTLIDAGIIEELEGQAIAGYELAELCKLTPEWQKIALEQAPRD